MVVVMLFSFGLSSSMGSSSTETPRISCRSTYRIYTKAVTLEQELLCKTPADMWRGGQALTWLYIHKKKIYGKATHLVYQGGANKEKSYHG
jgi:hypothetical protein